MRVYGMERLNSSRDTTFLLSGDVEERLEGRKVANRKEGKKDKGCTI